MIRININIDGDTPGYELVKVGVLVEELPISEIEGEMTPFHTTLKMKLLDDNEHSIEADWNDLDETMESVYLINGEVKAAFNSHPLNEMGGLDFKELVDTLQQVIADAPTNERIRFDIISPDGFSMHPSDVYNTPREAEQAFEQWKKRYEPQGHYRDNKWNIINLEDLRDHCEMTTIHGTPNEEEEETE